jgi:hypothetical protein
LNLSANLAVRILAGYIAGSFVVMEILYFAVWCRPFHNYWAVPTPNIQCSAATDHLITNAVFNISSDLIMLVIGFSLFIRSTLPFDRKLIMACIFGLGIFVVLAAVLNKYYSFTHPFGSQWTFWYVRESSTAMVVANLPFCWTLLRRMFKLDAFNHEMSGHSVPYHSSRTARGRQKTSPRHSRGQGSHWKSSKHGSHDSSMDIKPLPPPTTTRAPELPKPAKQPNWRAQGVFGREDVDALAFEPWDYGREEELVPISGNVSPTTGRRDSTGTSSPSSPGGHQRLSRRIRDEEAQYALQEDVGSRCHYYEGPKDNEESDSSIIDIKESEKSRTSGDGVVSTGAVNEDAPLSQGHPSEALELRELREHDVR